MGLGHIAYGEHDMTRLAITGIGGVVGLGMAFRARRGDFSVRGLAGSAAERRRAERTSAIVLEGDLCDGRTLERVLAGADVVLHAAELSCADSRAEFDAINVEGTRAVARAAREAGVRHFVHLSTGRVYGRRCVDGLNEEGELACDGDLYAHSKLKSEIEVWRQHKQDGMGVTILRLGHLYGPHSASLLQRELAALSRGEQLLPERGERAINHLHIDNLLDALELVFEQRPVGRVFNINDGAATSVRDYYACFAQTLRTSHAPPSNSFFGAITRGVRSALFERNMVLPPIESSPWQYSGGRHAITRARRVLGYQPRISLAEGMLSVVEAGQHASRVLGAGSQQLLERRAYSG